MASAFPYPAITLTQEQYLRDGFFNCNSETICLLTSQKECSWTSHCHRQSDIFSTQSTHNLGLPPQQEGPFPPEFQVLALMELCLEGTLPSRTGFDPTVLPFPHHHLSEYCLSQPWVSMLLLFLSTRDLICSKTVISSAKSVDSFPP